MLGHHQLGGHRKAAHTLPQGCLLSGSRGADLSRRSFPLYLDPTHWIHLGSCLAFSVGFHLKYCFRSLYLPHEPTYSPSHIHWLSLRPASYVEEALLMCIVQVWKETRKVLIDWLAQQGICGTEDCCPNTSVPKAGVRKASYLAFKWSSGSSLSFLCSSPKVPKQTSPIPSALPLLTLTSTKGTSEIMIKIYHHI